MDRKKLETGRFADFKKEKRTMICNNVVLWSGKSSDQSSATFSVPPSLLSFSSANRFCEVLGCLLPE